MSDWEAAVISAIVGAIVSFILMYFLYYKVFKWERERELVEKRLGKLYAPLYSNIEIMSACGVGMYLFDIDVNFETDLNNGIFSEDLRNKFKTENASISNSGKVEVIVGKDKWMINDEWLIEDEKKYNVKKENGKLKVYGGRTVGYKESSKEEGKSRMKDFLDQLIEQNSYLADIELQKLLYKMHGFGFYTISKEDIDKLVELITSEYKELRDEYCNSTQDYKRKDFKISKKL